jgi:hypothetical protein
MLTDSSECQISNNPETELGESHFPKHHSTIRVIRQLKSIHLEQGIEESEYPLLQFRCELEKTFEHIHQPKVALERLEKTAGDSANSP